MAEQRASVCFLNPRLFPIGGTTIRTLNFARAIRGHVKSVHIITWHPVDEYLDDGKVLKLIHEGISVDVLPIGHQFLRKHFRLLYVLAIGIEYTRFVRKIVENKKIDIVHCGNETFWTGVLLKLRLKRSIVADLHAKFTGSFFGVLPKAANALSQFAMKFALRISSSLLEGYICPTKELRDLLVSWGLPPQKVKTIPNAITASDTDVKESRAEIRSLLGLDEQTIVVAFHGLLVEGYNIDALHKLSQISGIVAKSVAVRVRFMIIGYYQKLPIKDENFVYTGYVENLLKYLSAADLAVIPIFENSMGIRSRLLDYFAVSLPVVTTPVGVIGMRFVQNSGGVIVRNSVEELAQIVIELAGSREKLKEMAKRSKEMAEWFSPEKIAKDLLMFYSEASRESRSPDLDLVRLLAGIGEKKVDFTNQA